MGEQELKNIARPVRVYRVGGSLSAPAATLARSAIKVSGFLSGKPAVAVLPFANMSSDPEQEFLADGIAEDVITALSRYPSLSVIARNSTFIYKGRAVEIRQVGRELGVRYVLEGSLRKAGQRVRVTAELIEAETGTHVWAERYEREIADLFAVQDEIAETVTSAIAPVIAEIERQRAMSKPADNLDAWAAYQRGNWHMSVGNADDNTLSQKFFAPAIELDPTLTSAYRGLANAIITGAQDYGVGDLAEAKKEAERLTRAALALVDDAEGRASLSNILRLCGRMELALAEADKALAANPNLAIAHRARAAVLVNSGKHAEGIAAAQTALRLEPRGPSIAATMNWIAGALYYSGDDAGCVEAARQVIHLYPRHTHPYRLLAAALVQLGRVEEAKAALEQAIAIAPGVFGRRRSAHVRPEDHERILDGLRKAGWNE